MKNKFLIFESIFATLFLFGAIFVLIKVILL